MQSSRWLTEGHRGRRALAALATLATLAWGAPVFAAGSLYVSALVQGEAMITLTAPDGSTQTATTSGGDVQITPRAGAGSYEIKIEAGGEVATGRVEVPERGQVRIVFNPAAQPQIQSFVSAIEEITVTAQRVEENLQQVPVAITALTSRQIELKQMQTIQQMGYETPNLYLETNTGLSSGGRAALRGVGEDESFFTSDTPVGIYIDDIYIPRQTGAMFDLYDLDRIEVLRGPQGTLYGRNTTAGAIRLITREPGNQFRAFVEGSLGEYSRSDLRASANAPLGDKAALSGAFILRKHDGYDVNKVNDARVNDQDLWGLRGSLRLLPSDKFNILLNADYLHDRSQPGTPVAFVPQPPCINPNPPFNVISTTPPCPTLPSFGVGYIDFSQQLDGDADVRTTAVDLLDPKNDLDQTGVNGVITWSLSPKLTLKSITGWRKMDNLLLLDADGRVGNFLGVPQPGGGQAPSFHLFQDQHQDQFSEELQLQGRGGKLRWIVGGYFFHEHNDQRTENVIFRPLGANNYWDVTLDLDSYAAFASFTYQASSDITVVVGGRYTNDSKDFDTQVFLPTGAPLQACVAPSGAIATGPCAPSSPEGSQTVPVTRRIDESWSAFTPRLAIDWSLTPEVMLYASASRGFKSGAFDGRANTAAQVLNLEPIRPETLWSYELGLKSDWVQNRLRLNVAAFLNDWNDLQGSGTDPAGNFKRFSLGDVETKGLELEARAVPTPGLELSGQLGVLDTRYKSVNFNQAIDCGSLGNPDGELELKYSPHASWALGASYTTQGTILGGRFFVGGDVAHKGEYFQQSCNAPVTTEKGYTLVNASIAYETKDGRWRLAATGENLNDVEYLQGVFGIAGLRMVSAYFNPPRRFSVTLRYSYD